jgi:haloalkane dehalogenase
VAEIRSASVLRGLSAEPHERYRAPVRERDDRWPRLEWPRQIPIDHVPPDVPEDAPDELGPRRPRWIPTLR